jgi:hypothetical protein
MKQSWRSFVLGVSAAVLADRIIDIQFLTWPALIIGIIAIVIGGYSFGRRIHS